MEALLVAPRAGPARKRAGAVVGLRETWGVQATPAHESGNGRRIKHASHASRSERAETRIGGSAHDGCNGTLRDPGAERGEE